MINKLINEHYFSDEILKPLIPSNLTKRYCKINKRQELDTIKKLVHCIIYQKQVQYKNVANNIKSYKKFILGLNQKEIEHKLLLEYLSSLNHPYKTLGTLHQSNEMLATYIFTIAPRERQFIEKYYRSKRFDILVCRIQKLKSYN